MSAGVRAGVALALLARAAHGAPPPELFPLDELRPGMTGVGRTVFEGTRVEEFGVTVIGRLANNAPRQSIVLARLSGGPLAHTGVMAGMSGSPVYIDGKLLGAVAYGFPFSKETIAGITPIGEMLAATRADAPRTRAACARFKPAWGADGPAAPLDVAGLVALLRHPPAELLRRADAAGAVLPAGGLAPLALPLVFSGFDAGAFTWARALFAGLGFTAVAALPSGGAPLEPLPPLEPGAPVGVSLIEGDLDVSATGTITHIDDDRVYAFGHPFFNLGPTQFPMRKAYVYAVFPSLYQSWKIAVPAEPVGTIDQDRTTAIAGRLGRSPRMIPMHVRLLSSRGTSLSFSFRIVDDELFTPLLVYAALGAVLQSHERASGTASVRVEARVALRGGDDVRVGDTFARAQPAEQAAALVAAPLAYLLTNDFAPVDITGVDVQVASFESVQAATLERVRVERAGPLRPGGTAVLELELATRRGERRVERLPLRVPATAAPGTYALLVADGAALATLEQQELRHAFTPRGLGDLLHALNTLRRGSTIYARLRREAPGAVVRGARLPALPPSVLSVLGAPSDERGVTPLGSATIWEGEWRTSYVVSGSHRQTLVVEP